MTNQVDTKPVITKESKKKIRVEFERTALKERLKAKYLSAYFAKRVAWFIFRFLLLIGIAFVVLQPFITMVIQSIMAPQDFVDNSVTNVPRNISFGIYKAIFTDLAYFKVFFTTLGLSLATALLQTFACCLVGYGLAKFKFRGSKLVFFAVILTMAIPHGTMQGAMYQHFTRFDVLGIIKLLAKINILPETYASGWNMLNTVTPLIIFSATALAFKNGLYIFMLRQFFRGVPDELEESAYLDGANTFRTFIQVILPISIPMMITVFLLAFCWQWTDDFYVTLFYTKTPELPWPPNFMAYLNSGIPDSLASLKADYSGVAHSSAKYLSAMNYGCGIMVCLPLIILFLFCQKYLVQGIERSGIVG